MSTAEEGDSPVAGAQDQAAVPAKLHYSDDSVAVYHGDCLEVLAQLPDNSVDSICTDPPYGLEFMGKDWDKFGRDTSPGYREKPRITTRGDRAGSLSAYTGSAGQGVNSFQAGRPFQLWCQQWATHCLRVLKPGGHIVAFGGTRTWHRLACAIEDAGFEIRDNLAWIYGSGFPKSLDVSKAIDKAAGVEREIISEREQKVNFDPQGQGGGGWSAGVVRDTAPATDDAKKWQGWGTALKPSFEPIVLARKPFKGTVAQTVAAYGTGAINIDACRVGSEERVNPPAGNKPGGAALMMSVAGMPADAKPTTAAGRFPPNTLLDKTAAVELDKQSGDRPGMATQNSFTEGSPKDCYSPGLEKPGMVAEDGIRYGYDDNGGASRFFPVFGEPVGRFPPNTLLDEQAADELDQQTGNLKPGGDIAEGSKGAGKRNNAVYGVDENDRGEWQGYGDAGGASKFFPVFNSREGEASADNRYVEQGGTDFAMKPGQRRAPVDDASEFFPVFKYTAKAPSSERPTVDGISHPTVKPLEIMRWLVKLVTPPGGTVLDPFGGSGTTAEACIHEYKKCIIIEREADYLPLIVARLRKPMELGFDFGL